MRTIFLVRHGRPDFPLGTRMCLGRTDLPLGALGRMQACRTARWLTAAQGLPVFSSPLRRAAETAQFFTQRYTTIPDLREKDGGDWDGLDFDEIRRRWPELYAARGADPTIPIPNAEPAEAVRARAVSALGEAMRRTDGDLLIAAHSFVIRAILGALDTPDALRQDIPHASVTTLTEDGGAMRVVRIGQTPDLPLTPALADALLTAAASGARIEAHCRAVAREALRIADALPAALDRDLLESAALLHDVARAEDRHAETAAAWLRELGYGRAAALIGLHHDHDGQTLDEAAILFLADKCVTEDRVVPLETRFENSASRCRTEEARAAHARRYAAARALKMSINELCRTEVVK